MRRDRIIVRIVLHGVLLVGASAAGFLFIALVMLGSGMTRDMQRFTTWLGSEACDRIEHSPDGQARVEAFPANLTVFSDDGRELASSSRDPIERLSPERLALLRTRGPEEEAMPQRLTAVACTESPARYVLVSGPPTSLPLGRLSLLVGVMVVLVALGSIPLARSLVKPLRELVATAHAFGKGDLTTRASVERTDELGELGHAFNTMATNLQAHLLAEKELLANISHELRTPLARVRVVLETAKANPSRAAALLHEISRDLTDLERLTDDVLATIRLDFSDASPPAAPRIKLRPERVELVSVLQKSIARFVETHPARDIELDADESALAIHGDPALLQRLFENLLENARKYSNDMIRVRAVRADGTVHVKIEDNGIGIDDADLERVFEPFFRTDRSRARASGGTGLGLTLCRRIVDVHGGTIDVESTLGFGTTVILRFPELGPDA